MIDRHVFPGIVLSVYQSSCTSFISHIISFGHISRVFSKLSNIDTVFE
jgi:hypothetical protein